MDKLKKIRKKILELSSEYAEIAFEREDEFIPGKSHVPVSGKLIGKKEIEFIVDSCLDGWFTTGRFSHEFEKKFAIYMDQRFCLLTNSGSSANLLALSALTSPDLKDKRLKKGDKVITVAAGFPTTVNPIIQNGLIPVFVDVNLDDYGIEIESLEKAYTEDVKAIMLAHTLGNPFNIEEVFNFAEKKKLWLIEDCCDAIGAKYNKKKVGTYGHIATASFYPAHHITMGEGGAVLTDSPKLKKIIESFRDWGRDCWCAPGIDNTCGKRFDWKLGELPHGFDHKYIYSHIGYNLKLTDMQAALGLAQLGRIEEFISKRINNYNYLFKNLKTLGSFLKFPKPLKKSQPSWFGFPIYVKKESPINRNRLIYELNKLNIGTRLLFAGNLLKQPAYLNAGIKRNGIELPNTDLVMENVFWVGVQPNLKQEKLSYIVSSFHKIFKVKLI